MSSTQITIAMAMEALDTLLFHFTDKKLQIAVNRFEFDETEIGQHFNIIRYEVPQTKKYQQFLIIQPSVLRCCITDNFYQCGYFEIVSEILF